MSGCNGVAKWSDLGEVYTAWNNGVNFDLHERVFSSIEKSTCIMIYSNFIKVKIEIKKKLIFQLCKYDAQSRTIFKSSAQLC